MTNVHDINPPMPYPELTPQTIGMLTLDTRQMFYVRTMTFLGNRSRADLVHRATLLFPDTNPDCWNPYLKQELVVLITDHTPEHTHRYPTRSPHCRLCGRHRYPAAYTATSS